MTLVAALASCPVEARNVIMAEMEKKVVDPRPATIILDIDGTLLRHFGTLADQMTEEPELLPGVAAKLHEWEKLGCRFILLTGRKESMRSITVRQLEAMGIVYDQLVMGIGGGKRVLINDFKENSDLPTAIAINVIRNEGLEHVEF